MSPGNPNIGSSASVKKPFASFFSKIFMTLLRGTGLHNDNDAALRKQQELAQVWSVVPGRDDSLSDMRQNCVSLVSGAADRVRVCFRNRCEYPLLMCWVASDQTPHHFYRLDPNTDYGDVTSADHVEQTHIGHAFLFAYVRPTRPDETFEQAFSRIQRDRTLKTDGVHVVGGYRSKSVGIHSDDEEEDAIWTPHLVEIHPIRQKELCRCGPFLRGSLSDKSTSTTTIDNEDDIPQFRITVTLSNLDPTPLDTSRKEYIEMTLGGWPVRMDAALVHNRTAEEAIFIKELEQDLEVLCQRLPEFARERLCQDTPVWVNRTLRYGPRACPVRGIGCCFHPDVNWLIENGMCVQKEHCVELYDLLEYHQTRGLWGPGGVMIHEMSHAYHFKCMDHGYHNRPLKDCWQSSVIQNKKYDLVPVHGSQAPMAKAYVCTNEKEYFAELSTAFLGGLDNEIEYNKWFPFNRKQVKEHDPEAYKLLQELWKCDTE